MSVYFAVHASLFMPTAKARFPRACEALVLLFLVADSVLAGVLLLELYFSKIYDQSDGFNLTYAGRTWFERHWRPLNSLGYRDREVAPPEPGQKSLVVLGDSFASGHGIKRPEDRFSDVAARALGPGWRVYNVAKIGWDTPDEITALREFPVKPDVVVLSYCLNDIFHAAREAQHPMNFAVNLPRGEMKALVELSSLADFLYWRLARGGNFSGGASSFWDSLRGAFSDSEVWAVHSGELAQLAAYCRDNNIRLAAVVFPMLQAPRESVPFVDKVSRALRDEGAAVLDLGPVFDGKAPGDLVVNAMDAHPNEAVHWQVGGVVAGYLKRLDTLGGQ
jgi:hypothetical protein